MSPYTLVQHSAWVAKQDTDFERAVESRGITARQANTVRLAGGLVFNSYEEADTAEYDENYPPGVEGMIAKVAGTFTQKVKLNGSPLYIPKIEAKGTGS